MTSPREKTSASLQKRNFRLAFRRCAARSLDAAARPARWTPLRGPLVGRFAGTLVGKLKTDR